ncbi:MAG: division/cell wall cluster transcriptional repressor MraZ [Acidimicrobiales bacterium]|nr:MAG: division/cell wall cluster transcriptional repressor MraZ [Acidimicrobiales bacterium]
MFFGSYEHSIDEKGRLVLPSAFRHAFEKGGFVAPYGECLGLWTAEEFAEVARVLDQKVREGTASVEDLRSFTSRAFEVRPDRQFRIVIPQRHRDHAGLTREVTVVGAYRRVEIWDRERWSRRESAMDSAGVERLGL